MTMFAQGAIVRPAYSEAALVAALTQARAATAPCDTDKAILESMRAVHQSWLAGLRTARVRTAHSSYVAVWLEAGIEHEIDAAWTAAPSRAFCLHALAGVLCMQALALLVPEIVRHGCAPVPMPDSDLAEALRCAGLPLCEALPNKQEGSLWLRPKRRYAIVSYAQWHAQANKSFVQNSCERVSTRDADSMQSGCARCALSTGAAGYACGHKRESGGTLKM